ncbi:MAG TPA: TonB-dependent receptor plug domain-containing protein [Opitutaceae bacterium]|nr:TonB-dependent receptor plug domain-containing protein [Opitutaceae bacterium]
MDTKHLLARTPALLAASTLCLMLPRPSLAQSARPSNDTTSDSSSEDETIELSPFIISASEDAGSYRATSTLAGTRVRTDLRDVASSISVYTKQFLQDTGARNNQDLLVYTTNTEVGGIMGNFSGVAGGGQFSEFGNLLRPQQNTRVRGLDSADNTRDYFLTEIPFDSYNVDRVDLQRGPNSILFGVGSPAGIVNASVNTATFQNSNKIENRLDTHGSARFSADFNYVLIPKTLALRVAALSDETKYQQRQAFNNDHRIFGAAVYEPNIFKGLDGHTSFRVNFERGDISANRPRTLPPVDSITPWFLTGTNEYDDGKGGTVITQNPNKHPVSVQEDIDNIDAYRGNASQGIYPIAYIYPKSNPGRIYWADTVARYNADNGSPTLLQQAGPYASIGIGPNGQPDTGINGLHVYYPSTIATYSTYAQKLIPGGNSYFDKTISDPTIFDFFNNLIDGPNSFQWQKWHAANFAFSQTFFDDRLGVQYAYDRQRYSDGARSFLSNSDTYRLSIDINSDLADGSPNPNFGRPYISNSLEQNNSMTEINRDGHRLTFTGELRASDFLGRGMLASIIGKHVFTGLLSQDNKETHQSYWGISAATPEFAQLFGAPVSLTSHYRSYDYMVYLGDSLKDASSASGANLSPVSTLITPPRSAQVQYFDNHWAKSTNPADPNYVDPAAPYTYTNGTGVVTTATQSENPANFGGWKTTTVNFLNADNGDKDALMTNDTKVYTRIRSRSFTWQGFMFDDAFVPVFGWRRDNISTRTAAGAPDALGVVNTHYDYNDDEMNNHFAAGETKSWGAVLHLPKRLSQKLPLGTDVSVFYNRSSNFKADAPRGDLFGNQIPNPEGRTKEYGFGISTLNDKLTIKVTWYETHVANATLSGGSLGNNSYYLWAVPVWGTAFVANADQGFKGKNDGNAWAWNYAQSDSGQALSPGMPEWENHPSTIAEKAAIEAWRQLPLEQNFFNAYGNEVALINVAAIRAGDWVAADPIWNIKFDNQPTGNGLVGFSGGPQISVDTVSKGQEYEVTAQPVKNWNLTLNVAKTFASRTALAPTIATYIENMTAFFNGPAGDIRLWGSATSKMRDLWHDNIFIPYQVLLAQEGSNVPEQAPWRMNAVTTYNFDQGMLNGAFIGGGFRWEDKRILGYELLDDKSSIDINKPLYGPTDSHFDLWFGYNHKIFKNVNWRIQANLRNLGEKTRLVPVTLEPDGSTGYSRIQGGTEYLLTNTFEF